MRSVFLLTLASIVAAQTFLDSPDDFYQQAPFCREPDRRAKDAEYPWQKYCKTRTDEWKNLINKKRIESGEEISWQYRPTTGECGPQCRPSCVTLMLDLEKFSYDTELTCTANELCHCSHVRRPGSECAQTSLEDLFDKHPKCYLEDADCLGPTLYDNKVAMANTLLPGDGLKVQQCDSIPDDPLYCRFQDWKLITPIDRYSCKKNDYPDCLERDTKIYWEFCNVVEEDPGCDHDEECDGKGNRCGKNCPKITEPFPAGWTTFVVSGEIPFQSDWHETCAKDKHLKDYHETTNSACFLERVDIYYPPENEDCGIGCPHCHDCPLLNLGDKFGPLEVVGFGHGIQGNREGQTCTACDTRAFMSCEKGTELDCDDLFRWKCEEARNCYSGEELGVARFTDNQCTFVEGEGSTTGGFVFANEGNYAVEDSKSRGFIAAVTVPTILVFIAGSLFLCFLWYRRQRRNRGEKGEESSMDDSKTDKHNETLQPISEDDESDSEGSDPKRLELQAKEAPFEENVETVHISNLDALRQKLRSLDCSRPNLNKQELGDQCIGET